MKSAFLNGELNEEVFVDQPKGIIEEGSEDKVCKLNKALYDLKQAPRAWYSKVDHYFLQHGFKRSDNESTLYKKMKESNDILLVCIYVNDIIYLGSSQSLLEEFKAFCAENEIQRQLIYLSVLFPRF